MSGKKQKNTLIELGCYDTETTYDQIQKISYLAVYHKLDCVSVPLYLLEKTKPYLGDMVKMSCMIDFPYGYSTIDIKHHSIIKACRLGANIIEFTINNGLIFNKEFDKLHTELKTSYELCKSNKVELRACINYRYFDNDYVLDLSSALAYSGIDAIITNTGNLPDDPMDNIIISNKIEKTTGIPVISSSPFFSTKHKELIEKSCISGIRINNYNTAKEILGSCGV